MRRTNVATAAGPSAAGESVPDRASKRDGDLHGPRSHSPAVQKTAAQEVAHRDLKKGVKGVAFLSRLVGSSKKKHVEEQEPDNASVASEAQLEGNQAEVFAQPVDGQGYNPRHPQPPGYIKVRSKHKERRDFDRLFLAQELQCRKQRKTSRSDSNKLRRKNSGTSDAETVWAMEFSKDGMFLAAAGADTVVRVWKVLSSPEDRRSHEKQETADAATGNAGVEHLNAPVFQSRPVREYEGHEATVLDLSWSKNSFLLSSSMDKTVRLWHVSRSECLCTFQHNDFVPSIAFHPKDDRFFLAGSLDSKLRLWSIPEKNVVYTASMPDMITAVAFMPDGKYAVAGTLGGLCMWYETEGLKYKTQLQVRSERGQGARGRKITAIQTAQGPGGDKLLITTNDSRIRLFNLRDKGCEMIFKGVDNNSSQIRASLSSDGRYVVCGSEDRRAYVWSVAPTEDGKHDRRPLESFEAHDTTTTVACMAPGKTKQLLGRSEDPVYDLCNPPPVTPMGRAERGQSQSSSKPPTDSETVANAATDTEARPDRPNQSPTQGPGRSAHRDGNIIVTADFTGNIKVFRQDCAWMKRRRSSDWDRSSLFRRGDRSSLAGSLTTKNSQRSLRDARNLAMTQLASSDRIISWRQDVSSSPTVTRDASPKPKPPSRTASPQKPAAVAAAPPVQSETHTRSETNTSASLPSTVPTSAAEPITEEAEPITEKAEPIIEQAEPKKEDDPLLLDSGRSYMFWDRKEWSDTAKRAHTMFVTHKPGNDGSDHAPGRESRQGSLAVSPVHRTASYVSRLSDERSRSASERNDDEDDDTDAFDDAPEHHDDIRCRRCGSEKFSAQAHRGAGVPDLICSSCGLHV